MIDRWDERRQVLIEQQREASQDGAIAPEEVSTPKEAIAPRKEGIAR